MILILRGILGRLKSFCESNCCGTWMIIFKRKFFRYLLSFPDDNQWSFQEPWLPIHENVNMAKQELSGRLREAKLHPSTESPRMESWNATVRSKDGMFQTKANKTVRFWGV